MVEALWIGLKMLGKPATVFWELKHNQRGRFDVAVGLVALAVLMRIAWIYCTGFVFRDPMYRLSEDVNLWQEALVYVIVWVSWTVTNWAVSTLLDGEGTLGDVAIASAYALAPAIVIAPVTIILSNVLTLHEVGLYRLVTTGCSIWVAYLVLVHVQVTHNYGLLKALTVAGLTVVVMALLWALCLLLYLMIAEIGVFGGNVWQEISLRAGI